MTNAILPIHATSATTSQPTMQAVLFHLPAQFRGAGGCVAFLRDGNVEAQHVWGFADLDKRIPMTSQTRMPICSISKQMLCLVIADLKRNPTAAMQARGGGDVEEMMEVELRRMLPELEWGEGREEVKVADLYNMQSGIRDYWAMTVLYGAYPNAPFSILHDAPHTLTRTKSLHFPAGTSFSYSNVNFHVLGRLVERVSGHSLSQLLAERVFIPAGMSTAELQPNTAGHPLPIVGYEGDEKRGFYPAENRIEWSGDAGIVASLEDMIAYEKYLERTYSDPDSNYSELLQPVMYRDGTPALYHRGLFKVEVGGKMTWGHSGGLRGFRLQRVHVPSEHVSVIVLFNHEAAVGAAAESILKKAFGVQEPKVDPAAAATTVKKVPEQWKGAWLDEKTQMLIRGEVNDKGELLINVAGNEKMTLKDEKNAECKTMTARLEEDGETLHIYRIRDHYHYNAKRLTKSAKDESQKAEAAAAAVLEPKNKDYAGSYSCEEVDSTFHCSGDGGMMYGYFEGFLGKGPIHTMSYVAEDVWVLHCPRSMDAPAPGDWTVVFKRGSDGKLAGVTISCWLARKLEYVRLS